MSALDFQKIKAEVARRHHVTLDEDDPILVTITLNELILEHYEERFKTLLTQSQAQLSAASAQQEEAAKDIASRIVTGAASYIREETQKTCDTLQGRLTESFARKLDEMIKTKRTAIWAAMVSVAAASFVLGAGLASMLHK
jgi:hypothetical protein